MLQGSQAGGRPLLKSVITVAPEATVSGVVSTRHGDRSTHPMTLNGKRLSTYYPPGTMSSALRDTGEPAAAQPRRFEPGN